MSRTQLATYGPALRQWRERRGLSQLDLAVAADVSQRHVSFLETGRSKPSREMVGHLARVLRIAPREQNALLLAAGFAPSYSETPTADLGEVGQAIEFLLGAHSPNMAIVIDRHWNIVSANAPALSFTALLCDDPPLFGGQLNALHLMFHPDGFRPHLENFSDVAPGLLWRLRDDMDRAPTDSMLTDLHRELTTLAGSAITPAAVPPHAGLITTVDFRWDGRCIRLFSCLAALESPADLTVAELRIETFFPADEASRTAWTEITSTA